MMSSGATLFDEVTQRLLVYTNRFNLLEILSSRLIPPRSGFDDERYFSDLAELCLGRVAVVAGPASSDVLQHVSAGGGAFPVALELDGERLAPAEVAALMVDGGADEAIIGAPGAAAWAPRGAIPLSAVTAVHFRSSAELDEHRVRRYENVRDDLPLVVSPELFESGASVALVPWLRALDPAEDVDLRGADRISGALILVGKTLPAEKEAIAVFASTLNGRGASKRTRPRGVAPWLFALVAGPRRGADVNERIFAAGVAVLSEIDYPQTWRPVDHARAVREAVAGSRLKASDQDDLNRHFDAIVGVLRNERDFRPFRPDAGIAAAKALLLALMRPDPDEQLAWPADETGADDPVRVTAAAFLGVLHGRKRLGVVHRPLELDDFLAEQEAAAIESSVVPSAGAVRVNTKAGVVTVTAVRTKRRLLTRELPPAKGVAAVQQPGQIDDTTVSTLEASSGPPPTETGTVDPAFAAALAFAAAAHATQPRKGTSFPYVVHPIRVAEILYRHGCEPDVVVAGLLHDVLEDTGAEVEELRNQFSPRVARLVESVSEPSKLRGEDRPRVERMDEAIAHVTTEPDLDVLRIIAADKLDNVRSIRDTIAERGASATWALFNAPAEEQSRYYRHVAEALTERHPREALFQLLTLEVQAVFPHPGDVTSARFFYAQPLVAPEQARPFLADAKVQWKKGRSAYELAHSWIGTGEIPTTVRAVLEKDETFAGCELVEGLFERQVGLRTPGRPSQTDLLLLLRLRVGHAVVAVEGKAGESFDKTVETWNDSDGKSRRLRSLCDTLGIVPEGAGPLRYQLLHRSVSAVYEAERYGASQAVMLVHAFADDEAGFADFDRFVHAFGLAPPERNTLSGPRKLENVELWLGWVQDRPG